MAAKGCRLYSCFAPKGSAVFYIHKHLKYIFLDAEYPKGFCVSNPVLLGAKGCRPYSGHYKCRKCSLLLFSGILNIFVCLDAEYPKGFCVSNPVLVGAKGCRPYLSAVCSTGVEVATKPVCAGQLPSSFKNVSMRTNFSHNLNW